MYTGLRIEKELAYEWAMRAYESVRLHSDFIAKQHYLSVDARHQKNHLVQWSIQRRLM